MFKNWLNFVVAIVFMLVGVNFAAAKPTEQQFCANGVFGLLNSEVSGGMLDLALDLEDYVNEEIVILSHMSLEFADKKDKRVAWIADIDRCEYDRDEPFAVLKRREQVLVVLEPSEFDKDVYREIRRILATTTGMDNRSKNHFVIIGTVKRFMNTLEPYVHVRKLLLHKYPS